jgi:Flp pilus assembly protein protease CpaA
MVSLTLLWLALCALQDWRHRRVSNPLTLPVLILGLGLRLVGLLRGDTLLLVLIIAAALVGWRAGLIGGADAKALIALALLSPHMALWAWMGATLWYLTARIVTHLWARNSRSPTSLPGFMGFLLGALAFVAFLR